MALKFPRVQPGDLITADQWNSVLDALESLDSRIGAGPDRSVAITGLFPAGSRRVGEHLTVKGNNFAVPAILNEVTVDTVHISAFGFDYSDKQLSFDLPDVPDLGTGKTVVIKVSNTNGFDTASLTLLPALTFPQGRLEVLYTVAPVVPVADPNIRAGTYTFTFSVTAFVDREATYKLDPTISGSGWTAQLLKEDSDQPRDTNLITIPGNIAGVRRDIRVQVTVPNQPNGSAGTLTLTVTDTSGGGKVTPGHADVPITIGNPPPTPETRVRVSLRSASAGAQIVGNKVQFARNTAGAIAFNILFNEASAPGVPYGAAVELKSPTGWTKGGISPSSIDVPNVPANQDVNVILTAGDTAASTDLLITISRGGIGGGKPITVTYAQGLSVS